MSVSYCITVCNEINEVKKLISIILKYIRPQDEIVILFDEKNGTTVVREYLIQLCTSNIFHPFKLLFKSFEGDFAAWKNFLKDNATKDFIFNIDADELPHENLLINIEFFTKSGYELLYIPRINIVTGITDADIANYNWRLNDRGWIQFPDYQSRLFANKDYIRWEGVVHETIKGATSIASLKAEEENCLYHIKDIDRQRKQNSYYDSLSGKNLLGANIDV